MGIRIELKTLLGKEIVNIHGCGDSFWTYVPHAEFKAACCRDLGLVDPDGSEGLEDTVDDMAIWQIDYIREAYEALKTYGFGSTEDMAHISPRKMYGQDGPLLNNGVAKPFTPYKYNHAADVLAAASRRLA